MGVSNTTFSIDKIFGRPISIRVQIPESEIIVENHWIGDSSICDRFFYIVTKFLECKFRSMHTDYNKSLIPIFLVPCGEIWEGSLTIDTRIRPKIDDDNFSLETCHRERIGIDPVGESGRNFWGKSWICYIQFGDTFLDRIRYC